jgi:hypothetical protein
MFQCDSVTSVEYRFKAPGAHLTKEWRLAVLGYPGDHAAQDAVKHVVVLHRRAWGSRTVDTISSESMAAE